MGAPLRALASLLGGLSLGATLSLHAQTTTQTIPLRVGWNAIWLEVEPTDNAIGVVFTNLPVEAVWAYFEKASTADFIQDVNELPFNNPCWRRHFPPPSDKAVVNNLFTVNVHRAYLVKATNAATLTVTGRPSARLPAWTPDSLNFRGFPVNPEFLPAFDDFFAPAPAHAGQPIYRLNANGNWELVAGYYLDVNGLPVPVPGTAAMQSGEAYWVYSQGASEYAAPLRLELEAGDGLDYDTVLTEQRLRLRNVSTNTLGVAIVNLSADPLPLAYYVLGAPRGSNWVSLPSRSGQALSGGETLSRRLAIQRSAFTSERYETVLNITDGVGTRYLLPVSAAKGVSAGANYTGLWVGNAVLNAISEANAFKAQAITAGGDATTKARAVFAFLGPDNDFEIVAVVAGAPYNGLNIFLRSDGAAAEDRASADYDPVSPALIISFSRGTTRAQTLIQAVNQQFATNPAVSFRYLAQAANQEGSSGFVAETTPTLEANGNGSEFNLRLLVHVDTAGNARLLKQVIQMWQDGTTTNDPSGYQRVDQPGRFILLTDDSRIMDFQGAALRDGEPVGRRLSCANFDFPDEPGQPPNTRRLEGAFAKGGVLTHRFVLPYDFPTNPFKHRYHPDHDNYDNRQGHETERAREALEITRSLELQLAAVAPPDLSAPDYGYSMLAGTYREEIEGLHKRKLVVTGTLTLKRVCSIGELNPPRSNP